MDNNGFICPEPVFVGGADAESGAEFSSIFERIAPESTLRVSVSDMDRYNNEDVQLSGFKKGWGYNLFVSSSNQNVARKATNQFGDDEGMIFVGPGRTTLTDFYGRKWYFVVSD